MNENKKISEAAYFLMRFDKEIDYHECLSYDLSAFLSAARSVLQYALEEAKTKTGGQAWYDSKIQGNKVLKFFKDKRDINIHYSPVEATKQVNIQVQDTIYLSESFKIQITDKDGNIIEEFATAPATNLPQNKDTSSVTISYKFNDWDGYENVSELCDKYLQHLKGFVSEGQALLFLT